jgi:hypothetical protein
MKRRKNLSLDADAVSRAERLARQSGKKLSKVVETFLRSLPAGGGETHFWDGQLRPLERPGDPRAEYLSHKHA